MSIWPGRMQPRPPIRVGLLERSQFVDLGQRHTSIALLGHDQVTEKYPNSAQALMHDGNKQRWY